ncbi:MAG: Na/Pi cotransporter family protein [Tissierellia bacterium]|nr:Na/Pi cotransporter family protein [Tissierellia bacterium]
MEELIFGVIGGTALLMYGVGMMGDGLEKVSGNTMKKIVTVLTGKVWSAFLVGILLTALIQSSTAMTVLTVGFVNSGLMNLSQAVGIIYGANIGTTVTAQLMAFSFKFKLTDIALPILGLGFAINHISKNGKLRNIGQALMGFGLMFLGLRILNDGIPYMQQSEALRHFFATYTSVPIFGILLGAFATAMVHSSAATVGLVMILSQAGLLDLNSAIYLILGDNIGTCITAQLASMSGNINARRTALAHTFYNVFGVVLALAAFPQFLKVINIATVYIQPKADISAYIANAHTLFNTLNALVFLPLTEHYVKFLNTVVKSKADIDTDKIYLDRLLLDTPVAALRAARSEIIRGAEIVKSMLKDAIELLHTGDTAKLAAIQDSEVTVNAMQRELTEYIVEISKRELTASQSLMVPATVSSINNIERIGDRTIEICRLYDSKVDRGLKFSEYALRELRELEVVIVELLDNVMIALNGKDDAVIDRIVELEDRVDYLSETFQKNHIERLNQGNCIIDSGVIYIDMIGSLERIADHAYKIGMFTKDELFGKKCKTPYHKD